MNLMQVFLLLAVIVACSCEGISTNPSSSHFFNRKLLKHIKSYIDVEAKPCQDFYQYACGNWAVENSIGEDGQTDYTSAVTKVNYEINKELAQYMDVMSSRSKPEFVKKARLFYKSCVDVDENYDMAQYMSWMKEHEDMTWALQVPSTQTDVKFDWVHSLAIMTRYGLNGVFLEEGMYERYEDSWKSVIGLDKPKGFTKLTHECMEILDENVSLPDDVKTFEQLWQEISEFEELLVKLDDVPDEDGGLYMPVIDLPFTWLLKYLATVLDKTSLNLNMEVTAANIPYMKALHELLEQYDDKFICQYLEVRFLWNLYETPKHSSNVDCVAATRGILSLSMNWIYEKQHPELEEESPKIHQIFDNIVAHIKQSLRSDKSGIVTDELLARLDRIQLKVGNLPRIDTVNVLDLFYDSLTLDASDFYGNHLKLSEFYFNASHSGYGNYLTTNLSQLFYVDTYDDGSSYLPYYLQTPNVVIAPLSLMRQPFYHWGYDDVYKYSSLGTRFAFVILEGIFDSFEFDHLMAGDLQKIEEIGSLHSAYQAFHSLLPDNLKEESFLKGSQLIFFLNYAQHYCEAEESSNLNRYITHFPEFSEAFDCEFKNFLNKFVNLPGEDEN